MRRRLAILATFVTLVGLAAACDNGTEPPVTTANPLADSSDQVLFGISSYLTDSGLLRARLYADTTYFFDNGTRLELRNLRTIFYTSTGAQSAVLTAKEGTSNGSRSQTEARKNVVVVSSDGKRLTTEQLRYNEVRNQISSDSAFVLTGPGQHLEGVGFISDPELKDITVLHRPAGGGTFTLPNK